MPLHHFYTTVWNVITLGMFCVNIRFDNGTILVTLSHLISIYYE